MIQQADLFDFQDSGLCVASHVGKLPTGLIVVPHFLSKAEERDIVSTLDQADGVPWMDDLRRRVKHFGYRYDYKARGLSQDDRIGDLPDWACVLANRLVENGYFTSTPEQVIVNEYLPGQGIAPHVDRDTCFGPTVASVSLGSDVVMDFLPQDADESDESGHVLFAARSAVILTGDARYKWRHGIAARKRDKLGTISITRARRLSLTFRTMLLGAV